MLTPQEIKSIINSGEGFNTEFKERLPTNLKSITEEICAFANASGCVVLIGVDDKNAIKGVTIDNSKRSAIQNSIGEISPPLQCDFYFVDVEGKNVAVYRSAVWSKQTLCFVRCNLCAPSTKFSKTNHC